MEVAGIPQDRHKGSQGGCSQGRLNHNFSLDTLLQGYGLPLIRANIELHRGNPSKALEVLRTR